MTETFYIVGVIIVNGFSKANKTAAAKSEHLYGTLVSLCVCVACAD